MAAIDLVEARVAQALAPEELHRRHASDVFLQERVDASDPKPNGPIGLAHVRPEPLGHEHDQRQHREGEQREPPVHHDQHDHDANEREDVAEDRDDAGGEEIVQDIDVGRHSSHQTADGIAIVELQIEPLQMLVDLGPHVEHDPLPGHLEHPGLEVLERERGQQNRQEADRDCIEAAQVTRRDVTIDRHFHQVWLGQLKNGRADDRRQRHCHLQPVRPQIAKQPAHQHRVVGLAQNFFVVDGHELNRLSAISSQFSVLAHRHRTSAFQFLHSLQHSALSIQHCKYQLAASSSSSSWRRCSVA